MNPTLSPDLITDLRELVQFQFMVNALEAGTIVAVLAALVGWYVVQRSQAFVSHTLSVMAFPGAAGAALIGLPTALGYYLACGAAALAIGGGGGTGGGGTGGGGTGGGGPSAGPHSGRQRYAGETASIGTVQAAGLAAGFLFVSLNQAVLAQPESLLFGTFLGVTSAQVLGLLVVAVAAAGGLALIARPLLFSSVDRESAWASGVPVELIDAAFLLILALTVAATSQITGALLVFALLVAPPACARVVTAAPLPGLALTVVFALAIVWLSLGLAYFTVYPVGFYVTTLALGLYLLLRAGRRLRR